MKGFGAGYIRTKGNRPPALQAFPFSEGSDLLSLRVLVLKPGFLAPELRLYENTFPFPNTYTRQIVSLRCSYLVLRHGNRRFPGTL